eukprot:627137-Prymnesium_polylepis.1
MGPPEHRSATSIVLRAQDMSEQENDYKAIFSKYDQDGNGTLDWEELQAPANYLGVSSELLFENRPEKSLTCEEFEAACVRLLGTGPRAVVIKFMNEQVQWEREKKSRQENRLDPRFVVLTLKGPTEVEFETAVAQSAGVLG